MTSKIFVFYNNHTNRLKTINRLYPLLIIEQAVTLLVLLH